MNIEKMLVLSTAHITEKTKDWLEQLPEAFIVYPKEEYGFFIPLWEGILKEKKGEIPNELHNIMVYAKKKDCDWIMLDRDAFIIDDLPLYEW
jgi:hypothetical protein